MTGGCHGGLWRRLRHDRGGAVAILFALGLPMLIGFAGLGVETGMWYSLKWQSQAAADNAALSAAIELASGKGCPSYSKLAYYAAGYNGFTPTSPASSFDSCTTGTTPNCTNTSDANYICVNSPPTSGAYANTSGYVEVVLSQQQNALLAALYLPSLTIQSRAVASYAGGTACVMALNTTASGAVEVGANTNAANVSLTNCWVISNSNSATSVALVGATSTLCAYNIWTAGNTGATITNAADCSAPVAGDITLKTGQTADTGKTAITDNYATGGSHPISYTAPTTAVPFGTQSTTNTATASGTATCSGSPPPAPCVLHFANTFDWNTVSGYQVSDLNETSVNGTTKISEGTTVYGGCTAPHCGTASKGDVYINNPVQDPSVTCTPSTGGVNGVCKGETISFTTSTSLQPDTLYDASQGAIGLVSGTYSLSPGVYYIVGEDPGTHGHKGVNTQGMALYMGSKATISSSGAVTFIVLGTASNPAGAVDINCSFQFTTGSLSLTAPSTSFTPNLGGSIPAGVLYYQDPAYADTTIVNLAGRAPCQAKGQGHGPPNTVIFGAGVTLSNASVIYTPATEFDFSGTSSSVCTILIADRVIFGLNTNPTSLTYNETACGNTTPPSAAATGMAE